MDYFQSLNGVEGCPVWPWKMPCLLCDLYWYSQCGISARYKYPFIGGVPGPCGSQIAKQGLKVDRLFHKQ